jgi:hypothetical protein
MVAAMGTLAASNRITAPLVAAAGQTVFQGDFPIIDPAAVFFQYMSGSGADAVIATVGPAGFVLSNIQDDSFTLTLLAGMQGGETCFIYSQLVDSRNQAYVPGGALRSSTLESDFTTLEAQMQEHARELGRSMLLPLGEAGATLPPASARAGGLLGFDANGRPVIIGQGVTSAKVSQSQQLLLPNCRWAVDVTNGPVTLTIPSIALFLEGSFWKVVDAKGLAGTNPITVQTTDAQINDHGTLINSVVLNVNNSIAEFTALDGVLEVIYYGE